MKHCVSHKFKVSTDLLGFLEGFLPFVRTGVRRVKDLGLR